MYERCVSLDPSYTSAWARLGRARWISDKYNLGSLGSDVELFARLAHVCRYCGLLQPALVAHQEARRLDPMIPTSIMHTYFMLGDYQRALETSGSDYGYGMALVLAMLGRVEEAVSTLRQRELANPGGSVNCI
jgi:hypothetical protein